MENAVSVSYATLIHAVGRSQVAEIFSDYDWSSRPRDLTMKNDYAVSYYRSTFDGKPCYYIKHSGIEYVFCDTDFEPKLFQPKSFKMQTFSIMADGSIAPLSNSAQGIFSVRIISAGNAQVNHSMAATHASAQALIAWLRDNGIMTTIEDGDEESVDEMIDWLETIK